MEKSKMIPGFLSPSPVCYMPKCSRIVHHKQHAYNERGQVIVVDLADEDRQEYVNSFKDDCGLKNVLAKLVKTGDVLGYKSMSYDSDKDAGDETIMPRFVNDVMSEGAKADKTIADAVAQFNKTTGLNMTLEEFTAKIQDGTLMDYVTAEVEKLNKPTEGGEQ